ncbi:MAG: peptidoglycan DD-metalloendopeptidase family protein [Alistipes sp.]|nr:peptidoglycan DD-metalloendopeptidase family protein [Alistipes sp.]
MKEFWNRVTDKRQLVFKERNGEEIFWRVNLSPLSLWACIVGVVAMILFVLLLLMAYTSILDILPKYRTQSERINEQLTEHIMRLDMMERNMNDILAYNEAVATIMGGSTPTLHSTILTDTIRYDKSRILPTRADSLLRDALESITGEYSLSNTKPLQSESARFSTPMRGSIIRNFDAPESSYDIAIMSLDGESSVMSVERGSVLAVEEQADGTLNVMIQHAEGYISVYKNLGETLVRKGQSVQSGAVIGRIRTSAGEGIEEKNTLTFELWHNGTAIDPELYILF